MSFSHNIEAMVANPRTGGKCVPMLSLVAQLDAAPVLSLASRSNFAHSRRLELGDVVIHHQHIDKMADSQVVDNGGCAHTVLLLQQSLATAVQRHLASFLAQTRPSTAILLVRMQIKTNTSQHVRKNKVSGKLETCSAGCGLYSVPGPSLLTWTKWKPRKTPS